MIAAPSLSAFRSTDEGKSDINSEDGSLELSLNKSQALSYACQSSSSVGSFQSSSDGAASTSNTSNEQGRESIIEEKEGGKDPQSLSVDQDISFRPPFRFSSCLEDTTTEKLSPHISRMLSMPQPSQFSQLQNPHRPGPFNSFRSTPVIPTSQSSQINEVSVELADSIQLVVQTMLQISPPQVLDPVKEQFSACALSVPASSMSALFTAMKNINYISANMSTFCDNALLEDPALSKQVGVKNYNDFDVGELLQCLGDAMSGVAAQAGVDFVIYHENIGIKRVYVSADESSISFALSHVCILYSMFHISDILSRLSAKSLVPQREVTL